MNYCSNCGKDRSVCLCALNHDDYCADNPQKGSWGMASLNPMHLLMGFIVIIFIMVVGFSMYTKHPITPPPASEDRYLSVHVNVDQEVNSDYVIWRVGFQNTGNDIKVLQEKFVADRERILSFLRERGFTEQEISVGGPRVSDQFARAWGQPDIEKLPDDARYILDSRIKVSTTNVSAVEAASKDQDTLLKEGIILTKRDWDTNPRYLLRNRIALERELYAQAIQKSHAIALQLAQGMNARIKNVRNTKQNEPVLILGQGSDDRYSNDGLKGPVKRALLDMEINYNIE